MVEGAARLEGARVLQELELEHEARAGHAEVRAVHFEDGRAAHMRGDAFRGGARG